MPEHPAGKPAGMPCRHLLQDLRCGLFGQPARPAVCRRLQPNLEMCGNNRNQALSFLHRLETATRP
ncbi:MAG TPA: YkgJ family cysteine cluster protein [Thiolinea sp.]|nr:YkgJ family cysteine cluster protein [Thiolinea sp.]